MGRRSSQTGRSSSRLAGVHANANRGGVRVWKPRTPRPWAQPSPSRRASVLPWGSARCSCTSHVRSQGRPREVPPPRRLRPTLDGFAGPLQRAPGAADASCSGTLASSQLRSQGRPREVPPPRRLRLTLDGFAGPLQRAPGAADASCSGTVASSGPGSPTLAKRGWGGGGVSAAPFASTVEPIPTQENPEALLLAGGAGFGGSVHRCEARSPCPSTMSTY